MEVNVEIVQAQGRLDIVPKNLLYVNNPVKIDYISILNLDSLLHYINLYIRNLTGVVTPLFSYPMNIKPNAFKRDTDSFRLDSGSSIVGYADTADVITYHINGETL